jgi:large subunit ribosomal protein L25
VIDPVVVRVRPPYVPRRGHRANTHPTRQESPVAEVKLAVTARTEFGKGAARRTRRAGLIPAVIYGHGAAPVHVSLPTHETFMALKHANALFSLELEGQTVLAIAKDVQRDSMRGDVEHVDLLIVRSGEKVNVEVSIQVVGETFPGTIHMLELQNLHLEVEATHIPGSIELDVSGLEAGTQVRAGELALPEGATLLGDADVVVLAVSIPQAAEEEEPEEAEAEVAADAAAAAPAGSAVDD